MRRQDWRNKESMYKMAGFENGCKRVAIMVGTRKLAWNKMAVKDCAKLS